MKTAPWVTVMMLCLLVQNAGAVTRHHPSKYSRSAHRSVQHKGQQHYSFVPDYKPSPLIQALQTPITGRVQHQEGRLQTATVLPVLTSPVTTSPLPVDARSVQPHVVTQKTHHFAWFGQHKPAKLKVIQDTATAENSWVDPLSATDAAQLSGILANMIHNQIPDLATPIILSMVPAFQVGNPFTTNLQYALNARGYQLGTEQTLNTQRILYRITPLDHALLVTVRIHNLETARLYARSQTGALVAASPLTQRSH